MSLLNALLGKSSQIDALKHDPDLESYLLDNEPVEIAFKLARDYVVFTALRVIKVDKQGVAGRRKEYQSIPYSRIMQFTAECKGTMDMDAELRIQVQGVDAPMVLKFSDNETLASVQRGLATLVCRRD